jgi:hypothetical protein
MRWRRIAVVVAAVVVAAGIGVGSWALIGYNELTRIDRSEPEVVTDEFLRAALVRKDAAGTDLYVCSDQSGIEPIKALRRDLDRRERDFGVVIEATWGAYDREGDSLTTEVTITARKNNAVESKNDERWRFTLVNDGGWRVCGAERIEEVPS